MRAIHRRPTPGDPCAMCFRECGIDRGTGERGYCGIGPQPTVAFEGVLLGEEPAISPTYGVYLAGCNLACSFCPYPEMTRHPDRFPPLDAGALAGRIARARESHGVRTVSLIGGEPSLQPEAVAAVHSAADGLPIVLNTNGLFSPADDDALAESVDVFLIDLHFGNDECAARLADATDYLAWLVPAVDRFHGIKDLILRFLLLPGHLDCCFGPMARLAAHRWPRASISLLANYLPPPLPASAPAEAADKDLLAEAEAIAKNAGLAVRDVLGADDGAEADTAAPGAAGSNEGEPLQIVILPDGRVVFTVQTPELVEVARALRNESREGTS